MSIPIFLFERATGAHRLNFKYAETKVVDLEENPEFSQLSAASAFFKSEYKEEPISKTEIPTLKSLVKDPLTGEALFVINLTCKNSLHVGIIV